MESLFSRILRATLAVSAVLFAIVTVATLIYVGSVTREIDNRLEQIHLSKGTQLFAFYPPLSPGQRFSKDEFQVFLEDQGYEEARSIDDVKPGQFYWTRSRNNVELTVFRSEFAGNGHKLDRLKVKLIWDGNVTNLTLKEIQTADTQQNMEHLDMPPKKIGAFVAGRLRTQSSVPLSDIPVSMRHAVMAVEDVNFLEHSGVSFKGLLRALWRDVKALRWVEGGSTLTQQLMKNLFFSREKAIARKVKEALFAIITEARHSKEVILEGYLNEVYLGQWSTHEIHGVLEGARYYYNKPISEISLSQAATLAAIIQAPNLHDPRKNPEKTLKRRNLVLSQMKNANFISDEEFEAASRQPLGVVPIERTLDDADYFIDYVVQKISPQLKTSLDSRSLAIYTTLNPFFQSTASRLLRKNLDRLIQQNPVIKKKEEQKFHLQSALIAINPKDCTVLALQGGRSYRETQFNRVLQGKRQPGSLFKPFVYLAAFNGLINGKAFTPITEIEDSAFTWGYENQEWAPKNYEGDFHGKVTLMKALQNSMNIPTAKVAQTVGIDAFRDIMIQAGIQSPLPKIPSLSLGSADVTPMELVGAYTTLANLGKQCDMRPFFEVFDENGNLIEKTQTQQTIKISPGPTFVTVQTLKGVLTEGTARSVAASGVKYQNYAGKTGTTNDYKDAWFVGFSPNIAVLVWVGYDEELKVGLTGSAAALPLWIDFIRHTQSFLPDEDFPEPDGVVKMNIDPQSLQLSTSRCPVSKPVYFLKGTEPSSLCPLHR